MCALASWPGQVGIDGGNVGGEVGGLVLAAGLSTRMGAIKQLFPIEGKPMVARVAQLLLNSGVRHVVVVVGHAQDAVEEAVQSLPVQTVFNPRYQNGEMIDSVRAGLGTFPSYITAALIALADQPFFKRKTAHALLAAYHAGSSSIYQPRHKRRHGHPLLLHSAIWPDVMNAPLGTTLRDIIHSHRDRRCSVSVDDPGILIDIDWPEDLRSFRRGPTTRSSTSRRS